MILAQIFCVLPYLNNNNQPIEIYKFGATGWPRVILLLILLVAFGNLYYNFINGSKVQQDRVGMRDDPDDVSYDSFDTYLKTGFILIIPFLYALSLKPVGFYFATPIFIALIRLFKWTFAYVHLILNLKFMQKKKKVKRKTSKKKSVRRKVKRKERGGNQKNVKIMPKW